MVVIEKVPKEKNMCDFCGKSVTAKVHTKCVTKHRESLGQAMLLVYILTYVRGFVDLLSVYFVFTPFYHGIVLILDRLGGLK